MVPSLFLRSHLHVRPPRKKTRWTAESTGFLISLFFLVAGSPQVLSLQLSSSSASRLPSHFRLPSFSLLPALPCSRSSPLSSRSSPLSSRSPPLPSSLSSSSRLFSVRPSAAAAAAPAPPDASASPLPVVAELGGQTLPSTHSLRSFLRSTISASSAFVSSATRQSTTGEFTSRGAMASSRACAPQVEGKRSESRRVYERRSLRRRWSSYLLFSASCAEQSVSFSSSFLSSTPSTLSSSPASSRFPSSVCEVKQVGRTRNRKKDKQRHRPLASIGFGGPEAGDDVGEERDETPGEVSDESFLSSMGGRTKAHSSEPFEGVLTNEELREMVRQGYIHREDERLDDPVSSPFLIDGPLFNGSSPFASPPYGPMTRMVPYNRSLSTIPTFADVGKANATQAIPFINSTASVEDFFGFVENRTVDWEFFSPPGSRFERTETGVVMTPPIFPNRVYFFSREDIDDGVYDDPYADGLVRSADPSFLNPVSPALRSGRRRDEHRRTDT
ncbi:hypothetical protein TGARI_240970A, partial [Toxoplasma gondii ARI]